MRDTLESQHRTIGALVVQSDADNAHYTKDDQELLQFVSDQIAAAIERKQMIVGGARILVLLERTRARAARDHFDTGIGEWNLDAVASYTLGWKVSPIQGAPLVEEVNELGSPLTFQARG